MVKCEVCKEKIGETFLNKVLGTYVKDEKGKKHLVCSNCQAKVTSKKELIEIISK
jgi:hypothetical protein